MSDERVIELLEEISRKLDEVVAATQNATDSVAGAVASRATEIRRIERKLDSLDDAVREQ